jgi:FO synthase
VDEMVTLFGARGREVAAVAELADELRVDRGRRVTWVHNRNINYTNVCTFKCKFCGFSKGPLSLNLRGTPYLLTLDDIAERVREAWDLGATEVCLQGGIHPDFDGDYYIDVCRAVKDAVPGMHVHGFTALEVTEGARRSASRSRRYLRRLKDAGLPRCRAPPRRSSTIRAALDPVSRQDDHRRVARVPPRPRTDRAALERHDHGRLDRAAPSTGPATSCAPATAEGDRRLHRVHPAAVRAHGVADLPAAQGRRGPTFRETVLMHAVGRIAYRG